MAFLAVLENDGDAEEEDNVDGLRVLVLLL
jgi:hypothetical protein